MLFNGLEIHFRIYLIERGVEMGEEILAMNGFIRLPDNMKEYEFYEKLKIWTSQQGVEYKKDFIDYDEDLKVQRANSFALFNKGKSKRYFLRVNWDSSKKKVAILMMNPSHATAMYSDNTVRFMIQYTSTHFNAGDVWIVNMSPIINPDSRKIAPHHFDFDFKNQNIITQAVEQADIIFLSWGDRGKSGVRAMGRSFEDMLRENSEKLYCFRQSMKGNPVHRNQRPNIPLDWLPQKVHLGRIYP